MRKSDHAFLLLAPDPGGFALTDLTGAPSGTAPKGDITQLKPNAGVRGLIGTALVPFTLSDPDPAKRAAIESKADPALKAQRTRLQRRVTLRFDPDPKARIEAIQSFDGDLGLDPRGALAPIIATHRIAATDLPEGENVARELKVGKDIPATDAHDLLLTAGAVGGVPVAQPDSQAARDRACTAPETAGLVPAAIGLAITLGVMGLINMAHGEFSTMGAPTGHVVQIFLRDYTLALLVAIPLAFAVTFLAGVAMERLVIRHLCKPPLETLLATFGISIALQQLFKNILGTQARPLTSPDWLGGELVFNDVVSISYIRVAIIVPALLFLLFFRVLMERTRLGLEVRAVTQNPNMAAAMGINPDRISMLTFGLGSGIAGIAGDAIGLCAKVTSEPGSDHIVKSFMTAALGGVGTIRGALAGAGRIGGLHKVIEWLNPSNTLAAQTCMILFIQVGQRGIIALRGRAAGD